MNPDYDYYSDKPLTVWKLHRDGVVYVFTETPDGYIHIESSHSGGTSGKSTKQNARIFWNSLVEQGYARLPHRIGRSIRKPYSKVTDAIMEKIDKLSETKDGREWCIGEYKKMSLAYDDWKKKYDKEYGIEFRNKYALEA